MGYPNPKDPKDIMNYPQSRGARINRPPKNV
jgi:hypothetical protein